MTRHKDYYHILGVDETSSAEEIKKAYRRQALQFHPDRNPGDKEAEEKFKLISEAYAVLVDPVKRAEYDRVRADESRARARPEAGFTYSQEDIFRDFFAGAYARQVMRDLAEEFQRSGFRFDEKFFDRVFFGGRGFFFGGVFFSGPGAERIQRSSGPAYRTSFSRAARQAGNQPAPDLEKQSPAPPALLPYVFKQIGRAVKGWARDLLSLPGPGRAKTAVDINYNLTITPDQARNGARVEVVYQRDGRSRRISVKVPPGTSHGKILRLKNMGRRLSEGKSGDLFLHIKVTT